MKLEEVGINLKRIYDAEIPVRLEWFYDAGYTWCLLNGSIMPRIRNDDSLSGACRMVMQTEAYARRMDEAQYLSVDWVARGCAETLEVAIDELLDAIKTEGYQV